MNYEAAIDFELNKRLAELLPRCDYFFNEEKSRVELEDYHEEMIGNVLVANNEFNPCLYIWDIMPIAVELGVKFKFLEGGRNCVIVPNVTGLVLPSRDSLKLRYERSLVICCIQILESKQ